MKKNWSKLRKNLPNKLHVGYGKYYEVLWQTGINSGTDGKRIYGMTYFEPNRIVLDSTQSDKESIYTTFHEYLHALSDEHEIGLTENQVRKLEKCYPYIHELVLTMEGKRDNIKQKRTKRR